MVANAASPPQSKNAVRSFGRFKLIRLLGKSAGTMVWLTSDPASSHEVMLTLPRVQPADAAALTHWQREARFAARLDHPHLASAFEVGLQDHWPFIAVDRAQGMTLGEWLAGRSQPKPDEAVRWVCGLLQGLAFAHEAGVAHLDLQLHSVLIDERGTVRLMAPASAGDATSALRDAATSRSNDRTGSFDADELRGKRAAAARDLVACGLLLHRLLAGQPALEQADNALVIARMAPAGREQVRLPWTTPLPVPEALRAIVDRCTSGQERLRYPNARACLNALVGWLDAQAQDGGGPLALLLQRLGSVGHLPALPGLAARVAHITDLESRRTDDIANEVLDDMALSFELLRTLNSAQVQGTQVQGNGPVLTLRRIISLIGVNGVRGAANNLRQWPGPLSEPQAAALMLTLDRVRIAAHVAQLLRPAGYDAQVIYLIATLQNLGRLMATYHFADEAEQIHQLTRRTPANPETGTAEQPGLSEEAAAYAVIGVDIEALGAVVARHWGLGDEVTHMARRLPRDAPVHKPESDEELLRLTASAANDAVDAIGAIGAFTGTRAATAIGQIAQRYGRALGISAKDVSEALGAAHAAVQGARSPMPPEQRPAEEAPRRARGLGRSETASAAP